MCSACGQELPKEPRVKNNRGTRLPEKFYVTKEMHEWHAVNTPSVDVRAETLKFVDYWRAMPGQRGVKLDWLATWRNWMRNARPTNGYHYNGNGNGQTNGHAVRETADPRSFVPADQTAPMPAHLKARAHGV